MLEISPMTLGEKIKTLRDALQLSQADLAKRVGVKQPAIALIEIGKTKTTKHIFKIATALGVKASDLDENISGYEINSAEHLSVAGEVRAGAWLEIDSEHEKTELIPISADQRYKLQRQYALRVVGTSMNKIAKPGTFVIVADWSDNGAELREGDLVVARRERGHTYEVTLKRARMVSGTWELWPESDDPKYQEPLKLEGDNPEWTVSVVGKVIGKYEPL
jgi:transcriptional regulator with XRE-family HTH domain